MLYNGTRSLLNLKASYSASVNSNVVLYFFFFQAEDGIRDIGVTGVQTCALPIYRAPKGTEKRRTKPQISRRKETIKTRAEISGIETIKTIGKKSMKQRAGSLKR